MAYGDVEKACTARGITPPITVTTEEKLLDAGTLESNTFGIALVRQDTRTSAGEALTHAKEHIILVLDEVRDPGNLGTIMRTADWFGLTHIIVSPSTVDAYNPKVIGASMGSFTRIKVIPTNLEEFLVMANELHIQTFGAFLDGSNISTLSPLQSGILVMGSESHGIQPELIPHIENKITIPKHGNAESLNVAVATGIILAKLVDSV
jgi:TrmH family RNA methyltransferase